MGLILSDRQSTQMSIRPTTTYGHLRLGLMADMVVGVSDLLRNPLLGSTSRAPPHLRDRPGLERGKRPHPLAPSPDLERGNIAQRLDLSLGL